MEYNKSNKYDIIFNIMALILIAIFCFSISPVTLQNDTFYTIKIGEHILQNGIDMHDPFSYHNIEYTYPHWLYDVGIYLFYNLGGQTRSIYINSNFMHNIRYSFIFNKCKANKKQTNIICNNNRCTIYAKRFYSCKSTASYIYIICSYNIFYRAIFRYKKNKICGWSYNNTNNYS